MNSVAMIHLVSTLLMVGLILFVQVVHYPLMARVGAESFQAYQAGHTFRTSLLVVPLMVTELATALWLAVVPGAFNQRPVALAGLGLLAVIWTSTALLQAPSHGRLAKGFDASEHSRLVQTNWIRTASWVARVPVAFALLAR